MTGLPELMAALGDSVVTDVDIVDGYRRDSATWASAGTPLALARPRDTAEVQALARWRRDTACRSWPVGPGRVWRAERRRWRAAWSSVSSG